VNDPHTFLNCEHNIGVGLNPVPAFGDLKGFQFVHVLSTEIRTYYIVINCFNDVMMDMLEQSLV